MFFLGFAHSYPYLWIIKSGEQHAPDEQMIMEDKDRGEVILYQSEDGNVRLDVRLENETVWLTIEQMAALFGKARSTINEHILNVFQEGELKESESIRKIGSSDFSTKPCRFLI